MALSCQILADLAGQKAQAKPKEHRPDRNYQLAAIIRKSCERSKRTFVIICLWLGDRPDARILDNAKVGLSANRIFAAGDIVTPVGSAEVVENLRIAELECWKIILHLNGKVMRKMQKQSGRDRKFYFFFFEIARFFLIPHHKSKYIFSACFGRSDFSLLINGSVQRARKFKI